MNPAVLAVKQKNTRRLLDYLIRHREASRAELARALGVSVATITNITAELLVQNVVYESGYLASGVGKRASLLRFSEKSGAILAINMRPDHVVLSACDLLGTPYLQRKHACDLTITDGRREEDVLRGLIELIQSFLEELPQEVRGCLRAAGVSVCGMINARKYVDAPIINWRNVNLIFPLQAALKLPVYAEDITRTRATYELQYVSPEQKNVIYLNLTDGVGMAQFFQGTLVRGKTGIAGEIGHMSLNLHGEPCYCGNRGCFELYCGAPQVLEKARERIGENGGDEVLRELLEDEKRALTMPLLFEARERGSLLAGAVLSSAAEYLGAGLAAIYNIYDPDVVILCGYLGNTIDYITEQAIAEARSRMVNHFSREIHVQCAKLENDDLHLAICHTVLTALLDEQYSG